MIRRSIFIIVFSAVLSGIIFTSTTYAVGRIQPDPAVMSMADGSPAIHVLRAHSSGSVTALKLAAYFDGRNENGSIVKPDDKTITILNTSRTCRDSGGSGGDTIGIVISISGREVYKKKGDCSGIVGDYQIRSGDFTDDRARSGKWKATIDFELYDYKTDSDGNIDNSKYKASDSKDRTYYFRAQVSQGGLLSARKNDSKKGYGIVGNGAGRDVSYTIPFAMPADECAQSGGSQRVGMWDPDSGTYGPTEIRLEESIRGTDVWSNSPVSKEDSGGSVSISASGGGWYSITGNSGTSAWLNFTAEGSKEYRFSIRNDGSSSNVYSFFWPYDTIYSTTDCRYSLKPTLTLGSESVDPGGVFSVSAPVDNQSVTGVNSENTEWRVTKIEYPSNVPFADINGRQVEYSNSGPCAVAAVIRAGGNCNNAWQYINPRIFSTGSNASVNNYIAPNEPGKRICFINSVKRPVSSVETSLEWRHSAMRCTMVAKKPKVHILGSDLRVLRNIQASRSEGIQVGPIQKTFGSWSEYGAFSVGPNSLAGSGSSFKDGTTGASESWSKLTFSNNASSKGNYGANSLPATTTVSDFDNLQPTGGTLTGDINLSTLSGGVYNLTGSANISGTVNSKNTSIIIRSSGTVTIDDDIIVNDGVYNSPSEISQVVIVANNITISRDVPRVDSWLLTRGSSGSVNTCREAGNTGDLVVSSCPIPLLVNGAIITDKLYLRRTAGAEVGSHEIAAEVFNLRASSYMWAYNFVNQQDRAQTTYVKELPPRL